MRFGSLIYVGSQVHLFIFSLKLDSSYLSQVLIHSKSSAEQLQVNLEKALAVCQSSDGQAGIILMHCKSNQEKAVRILP